MKLSHNAQLNRIMATRDKQPIDWSDLRSVHYHFAELKGKNNCLGSEEELGAFLEWWIDNNVQLLWNLFEILKLYGTARSDVWSCGWRVIHGPLAHFSSTIQAMMS
ncbi:hypothetical protein BDW59DRAFT_155369 [Aspergillus cavernicola]|uniref:Uncharacterized protein n=1 Tax=Aspergillus cavernicola TaxID=176166 RepID=A0ABR4H9K1_9EURO